MSRLQVFSHAGSERFAGSSPDMQKVCFRCFRVTVVSCYGRSDGLQATCDGEHNVLVTECSTSSGPQLRPWPQPGEASPKTPAEQDRVVPDDSYTDIL